MRFLFPKISFEEIKRLIKPCLIGAVAASLFGILHDQVTYTVSPEYFTEFKYHQFSYLPFTQNHVLNITLIGIMGTWWVGLFSGWFLGRWHLMSGLNDKLHKKIYLSYVIIFSMTLLFTIACYFTYGGSDSESSFITIAHSHGVTDIGGFVTVGYIHNASYLGVLAGVLVSLFVVKRS